ncbi:MAG TPA: MFS transporter [Ignavibacteriaceae bacterium]|nr:MFS transporter [Ignavibacteriaceae bacterium]
MKKIPKPVIILGLVSLFTDIASEMLYPVTPLFMVSLGASMGVIGLVEGLAEVTAGFLKGYFGFLSDKVKRRNIFVVTGYTLSALSKPLPGIFSSIGVVVGSRVTDRIGKGIRTAPRDALLASYSDGNTGAIFGFHRAMDTLGAAIGPIIALILLYFYKVDYKFIFLIAFVPSILAVIVTLFVKDNYKGSKEREKVSYISFMKEAPKEYKILLLLITIFSFANSSDVFIILKAGNISKSSNYAIAGYIFYNLVYALSSYPIGKFADKLGKRNIFTAGILLFSFIYLGFGLLEQPNLIIIFILFIIYGIYASSTEGVTKAWVSDLIHDSRRSSAIGLLTMIQSFAVMLGSVAAGVIWDQFGSQWMFYTSAILSFLVFLSLLFWRNKINKV